MGAEERTRALEEGLSPVRELRDSLVLLVLAISSLSAYIGLGVVAVRLFASR